MSKPVAISGFPELLPQEQLLWEKHKHFLAQLFQSYGFLPLETPAVERLDTLQAKGGDHEIYGLYRLAQETPSSTSSASSLGLCFDLTVPLARYVAQHHGSLVFPYRRYHIAPVWRGERPQKGRYRQFYQCDIDVMGRGTLSPLYDGEIPAIMAAALEHMWGGAYTLRFNHRQALEKWLMHQGVGHVSEAMRILDKAGKMPQDVWETQLAALGLEPQALRDLQSQLEEESSLPQRLTLYSHMLREAPHVFREIETIIASMVNMGIPTTALCLDPLLARGLTYYTGTVYEITLPQHPDLGAICAGGRYGNLTESFCSQSFPGVGMSLGLSRLFAVLQHGEHPLPPADVLVTVQDAAQLSTYIALAQTLRQQGWRVEVFLDDKPLKAQMHYAGQKGFTWVLVANAQELAAGQVQVRHLASGAQEACAQGQLHGYLKSVDTPDTL